MIDQSTEFSNQLACTRDPHDLRHMIDSVVDLTVDSDQIADAKFFELADSFDHLPDHWISRFKNVGLQRTIGVVDERLRCYRSKR